MRSKGQLMKGPKHSSKINLQIINHQFGQTHQTPQKNNSENNPSIFLGLSPFFIPPKVNSQSNISQEMGNQHPNQLKIINTPFHGGPSFEDQIDASGSGFGQILDFNSDSIDEEEQSSKEISSGKMDEESSNSDNPESMKEEDEEPSESESISKDELKHRNEERKMNKLKQRPIPSTPANKELLTSASKKISCNCKKTKCLKLYCDCFRLNQTCDGCNCQGCHNLEIYSEERSNAIVALMDRNPDPFGLKIQDDRHVKGCNCKKSNCLKKYCQCYQAGLKCGDNCKCEECKNLEDKDQDSPEEHPNSKLITAKKQKKMVEI